MIVVRRPLAPVRRLLRVAALVGVAATLAACGNDGLLQQIGDAMRGAPLPRGGGYETVGRPYEINGRTYYPEEDPSYSEVGMASWYGSDFHGHRTANGEIYDMNGLSAAHTTLPLPSYVRVTNLQNGASIIVRVNDRGPFHASRVIDVSARAAYLLGMMDSGVARVQVDYVGRASLEGDDERMLMASYQPPGSGRQPTLLAYAATVEQSTALNAAEALASGQPPLAYNPFANAEELFAPAALVTDDDPLARLMSAELRSYAAEAAPDPAILAAVALAGGAPPAPALMATVQIGVFSDPANADGIAAALEGYGTVIITESAGGDGTYWSVKAITPSSRVAAVIAAAAAAGAPGAYRE
ncbi:MAG: septal ring lytic transglycosylase RlpA family protein [Bauldia sp.]|nr:septal ring lytic transglycosylase RlpA family protein [Bauldia sp.]